MSLLDRIVASVITGKIQEEPASPQLNIHLRWMIRRDMRAVMRIEEESFGWDGWDEDQFIWHLRQRNVLGFVAVRLDGGYEEVEVLGFALYGIDSARLEILNMAVAPRWRRHGVGSQLISMIRDKVIKHETRRRLDVLVKETNLEACCFLRSCGLRCERIERAPYEDSDDDGLLFSFHHRRLEVAS